MFGVERPEVANDIASIMARHGVPAAGYEVRVTEPIHFASTLRDVHRPVVGGVQIHWSQYVCTLGFSVDHAGGRSFVTNSHCTDNQGSTGNTQYNQPTRTQAPDPIGFEADDPAYFRRGECSRGKVCRYSDAARALYEGGIESQARIARTTGENNGSPVFTYSVGDNVQLVGILWGGNSSGDLFVFSPFKSIQDELGTMDATTDGVGAGDGDGGDGDGGGDDGGDDGENDGPNCPPNSNNPRCR